MSKGELFKHYDSDLVLRLHNAKDLNDHRTMLTRLRDYLNGYPPSPELAKGFLSQYANRKSRTLARYSKMISSFIKCYGEAWYYKVNIPKILPAYVEDSDIEKLFKVIETKKTHRGCVVRDILMVAVALKTGMRCSERANLEVRDIHSDFIVVRNGKGGKKNSRFLEQNTGNCILMLWIMG